MYHASSALSSGWGIHSLKFRNCPTGARSEEHARDILAEKQMADDAFESDEFDPKEYNVVTFGTPDDHAVFGVAHSSVDFNVTHLNERVRRVALVVTMTQASTARCANLVLS